MSINVKELCKQIKKSDFIVWSLQDGFNYLTNRHWAVKYKELPREVLIQLFILYMDAPEEGKSINFHKGTSLATHGTTDVKKIFDTTEKLASPGVVTSYIKVSGGLHMRVLKHNDQFLFVRNEYMNILKEPESAIPHCSNRFSPVLFIENSFLVLPYRIGTVEVEILGELVG